MIMNMYVNRWSAYENDQDNLLYSFLEIMLINELTIMHYLDCALTCRTSVALIYRSFTYTSLSRDMCNCASKCSVHSYPTISILLRN